MDYVALAISLLQTVLASAGVGGAPAEVVTELEAAITKLLSVTGSNVTYQQLEALRSKKTF